MQDKKNKNIIIYAPNIHTGGGLTLLSDLLSHFQLEKPLKLFLDQRAKLEIKIPDSCKTGDIYWVKPSIYGWIKSELKLNTMPSNNIVICLHNIPPIIFSPNVLFVYFQNRIILEKRGGYSNIKIYLTCKVEYLINILFSNKATHYICQTKSMKVLLEDFFSNNFFSKICPKKKVPSIKILPFRKMQPSRDYWKGDEKKWDFCYIASGEPHKNHKKLLEAWVELAENGLYPSLCLTVACDHSDLNITILKTIENSKIRITNLGKISQEKVMDVYKQSSALIFPSAVESLGLPLLEAASIGLPILAAELDYVRDICIPSQTFDPNSAISIARSVKRFLSIKPILQEIYSPNKFWDQVEKEFN